MSEDNVEKSNGELPSGVVEENETDTVTMMEVWSEQQQLKRDTAVLFAQSDDNACTYNNGYMPRQALYSCLTCSESALEKQAGVCVACSFHCHDGHQLVELYTKRNFRCDCGNPKFANACKLTPKNDQENEKNLYNQNFRGFYCTCKRPYPDPEAEVDDEMSQCVVCEDWFHLRHLNKGDRAEVADDFDELICGLCCDKHPFFHFYENFEIPEVSEAKKARPDCILIKMDCEKEGRCALMKKGWRDALCTCSTCLEIYKKEGLDFLRDAADPFSNYEKKASPAAAVTDAEQEMKALSGYDRTVQIDMLREYDEMKAKLNEYLQTFAAADKTVREEDIKLFFSKMTEQKRRERYNRENPL